MMRHLKITLILLIVGITLTACATLHPQSVSEQGPGFWSGLWHGMILPFAFIGRLFTDTIAIYEAPNNGGWYDFGFMLGLIAWGRAGAEVASNLSQRKMRVLRIGPHRTVSGHF